MDPIEEALERGREAARGSKWEPLGIEHSGWLTAKVKNRKTDEVEGIYEQHGSLLFTRLGRTAEGKVRCYRVTEDRLRRIVRAMFRTPDRGRLINAAAEARRRQTKTAPKRARRKR